MKFLGMKGQKHEVELPIDRVMESIENARDSDTDESFDLLALGLDLYIVHLKAELSDLSEKISANDAPLLNWHAIHVQPAKVHLNPVVHTLQEILKSTIFFSYF